MADFKSRCMPFQPAIVMIEAHLCPDSETTGNLASAMKKIFSMIAFGWGIILIALFFYTDLTMPAVNQNSDYLMTFYTAGELVREGNTAALYPPADAGTFVDTAFD